MNERFHIIVTGENGRSSSFQLSKKKFFISAGAALVLLVAVCTFGYFTTGSYFNSKLLSRQVNDLEAKLAASIKAGSAFMEEIGKLKEEHLETLARVQDEYEIELADQKMKFDLENTNLQLENVRLMSTAVSDLNERSELIESVMDTIGVKLKNDKKTAQANSGGPFIPAEEADFDDLLKRVDEYLQAVKVMPLGRPVNGSISSGFGKRADPVNSKNALHEGVDIRGDRGEKVYATASGKVIKAFKNGGYGNYVKIDHGNGYYTVFAHLQNYLVKKGEWVEQGQVIGQVGSTGRSTGPHLHYEILLNNKPINPTTFMKVADISHSLVKSQE